MVLEGLHPVARRRGRARERVPLFYLRKLYHTRECFERPRHTRLPLSTRTTSTYRRQHPRGRPRGAAARPSWWELRRAATHGCGQPRYRSIDRSHTKLSRATSCRLASRRTTSNYTHYSAANEPSRASGRLPQPAAPRERETPTHTATYRDEHRGKKKGKEELPASGAKHRETTAQRATVPESDGPGLK